MYINCKFVDDSKLKANILIQQRINCLSLNRNSNSEKKKDSLLYIQDGFSISRCRLALHSFTDKQLRHVILASQDLYSVTGLHVDLILACAICQQVFQQVSTSSFHFSQYQHQDPLLSSMLRLSVGHILKTDIDNNIIEILKDEFTKE